MWQSDCVYLDFPQTRVWQSDCVYLYFPQTRVWQSDCVYLHFPQTRVWQRDLCVIFIFLKLYSATGRLTVCNLYYGLTVPISPYWLQLPLFVDRFISSANITIYNIKYVVEYLFLITFSLLTYAFCLEFVEDGYRYLFSNFSRFFS